MLSTDSGDGVIVARIGTTVSDLPNLDVQGVLPELVLKDVEEGEMAHHQPKGLPWVTYSKIL